MGFGDAGSCHSTRTGGTAFDGNSAGMSGARNTYCGNHGGTLPERVDSGSGRHSQYTRRGDGLGGVSGFSSHVRAVVRVGSTGGGHLWVLCERVAAKFRFLQKVKVGGILRATGSGFSLEHEQRSSYVGISTFLRGDESARLEGGTKWMEFG